MNELWKDTVNERWKGTKDGSILASSLRRWQGDRAQGGPQRRPHAAAARKGFERTALKPSTQAAAAGRRRRAAPQGGRRRRLPPQGGAAGRHRRAAAGSPEELRGFNDVLSHRHTANPDTPKESTRARGDFKSMFLQKELAKFVHTAPKYPKKHLGLACFTG